ncbi:hypothetical protein [Geodermatophilus sp. URMC 62]|uniref:hypothetical protein n=1 Tax=Geodermatophilus sp. URMC 62 TaxID=3423414 RepID=UPI00406D1188
MTPRRTARVAVVGTAVVASALLVSGAVAGADPGGGGDGDVREVVLEFHVVTSPFSYTDLGEPGPSAADVIVFSDRLQRNGADVGHEVGSCVVVDPSGLSNCTAVATLDGEGTVAYAFENAPPPEKTLAVTGGSGDYRTARGDGVFLEHGDGTATLTLSLVLG